MRIAMWSGPRNMSTAMMYSFGNRPDFDIMDEPFYAAYLEMSGVVHPMADVIIASHETDPNMVGFTCMQAGSPHLYMKHMPHHMLAGFPIDWSEDCTNIHLIRHPARVIASYAAKRESPTLDDLGYQQQSDLFSQIGGVVIDSTDIRADPAGMLQKLCQSIDLPYDAAMLDWPAGPREQDGVWAAHWYKAVHASTGFAGAEGALPSLDADMQALCDAAMPYYTSMATQKIT